MYKIPPEFNASVLVGTSVELICFAKYSIYVHLSSDVIITILSEFALGGEVHAVPLQESSLMALVGHEVVGASTNDDGQLALTFDDGKVLAVINVNDNYESYTISIGGKETIV